MNKYLLFLTLILFLGCKNQEMTFEENLISNISNVYDLNKNSINNILIITETDCNSCFDRIESIHETEHSENLRGLFYAKDSIEFKKLLLKINSNIQWTPLPNRSISNSIEKAKNNVGPYIITIAKDSFSCQKF